MISLTGLIIIVMVMLGIVAVIIGAFAKKKNNEDQ